MHLFVEEKIIGRLSREANTYLCSPADSGKWSSLDNYTYNNPVSCKRCLQIMKRWQVED